MLSWGDLKILFRSDMAAAVHKWMEARDSAREELRSGLRAAGALQPQ